MSIAVAKGHGADRAESLPVGNAAQLETWSVRRLRDTEAVVPLQPDHVSGRTDPVRAPRHLAWPDKAGLVIAVIVAAMSIFACAIVLLAGETVTYGRLNNALAAWTGMAELGIALPIWLLMRVIDTVTGGPWHRHADRTRRSS